jgi:hypothetical protein
MARRVLPAAQIQSCWNLFKRKRRLIITEYKALGDLLPVPLIVSQLSPLPALPHHTPYYWTFQTITGFPLMLFFCRLIILARSCLYFSCPLPSTILQDSGKVLSLLSLTSKVLTNRPHSVFLKHSAHRFLLALITLPYGCFFTWLPVRLLEDRDCILVLVVSNLLAWCLAIR